MILQEVFETADLLDLLDLLVAGDPYLTKPNQQPIPTGSMYAIYMVTFTINIPPMLAYIPYMDPMGYGFQWE